MFKLKELGKTKNSFREFKGAQFSKNTIMLIKAITYFYYEKETLKENNKTKLSNLKCL